MLAALPGSAEPGGTAPALEAALDVHEASIGSAWSNPRQPDFNPGKPWADMSLEMEGNMFTCTPEDGGPWTGHHVDALCGDAAVAVVATSLRVRQV